MTFGHDHSGVVALINALCSIKKLVSPDIVSPLATESESIHILSHPRISFTLLTGAK